MLRIRRTWIFRRALILLIIFSGIALYATGIFSPFGSTSYYVSPTGDDTASGASPEHAWKTVERVNKGRYAAGDRILFEGEKNFPGTMGFGRVNFRGNDRNPVTISSYGTGRAIVGGGIAAVDVGGLTVENINFIGADTSRAASAISLLNSGSRALSGIRVVDVEVANLNHGLQIVAGERPAKYSNIHLERVSFHDNVAGIAMVGNIAKSGVVSGHYAIGDIYIGHSAFVDNTGFGVPDTGNGMSLMNVENVVIEHNRVANNGGDTLNPGDYANGTSAILVYDGRNVTIQHNDVSRQHMDPDAPTDNAGIDLWATDSTVQYNYVHDNEGWGMILGAGDPSNPEDPFPWPSERNTIRYNIFENNGRRLATTNLPEFMSAQLFMFGPIKDFELHNNTFYSRNPGPLPAGSVTQAMVSIVAVPPARSPEGIRFRNNIFAGENIVRFIELPLVVDALFENNAYIGGASAQQVQWGADNYDKIAAWSEATDQERMNGTLTARLVPRTVLCAPGSGRAAGYRLAPGSPLIDAARDFETPLDTSSETQDVFGNPPQTGSAPDIGAHEWKPGDTC